MEDNIQKFEWNMTSNNFFMLKKMFAENFWQKNIFSRIIFWPDKKICWQKLLAEKNDSRKTFG